MAKGKGSKGASDDKFKDADPEIIEEMRAAGELDEEESEDEELEEGAGSKKKAAAAGDDEDEEEGEDEDEGDDEPEPKGKAKAKPKTKAKPGAKSEEDADAEDDEEDGDDLGIEDDELPGKAKGVKREAKYIPAWKAKEMAKKAGEEARAALQAEFDQKLKDAAGKPKEDRQPDSEDIKAIAEEFNMAPEQVSKFVDRIATHVSKSIKLPEEATKALDTIKETERLALEEKGFNEEWEGEAAQQALEAVAGDREITEAVKKRVKALAYTTTYAEYRLEDIIRLESDRIFPKGKATAERGKGGTGAQRSATAKSLDEMKPEDIDALSDEEFDRLSDELGKGGSRFTKSK